MSRKFTTYKHPPITDAIAAAVHISVLAAYRDQLSQAFASGQLTPSEKTKRDWLAALWARVIELMRAAPTPEEVMLIYSVTMGWAKPPGLQLALEVLMQKRCAELPSPAERLKAQGIVIAGVTG